MIYDNKSLIRQTVAIAGGQSFPVNVAGNYVYVHRIICTPGLSSIFRGVVISPDRGTLAPEMIAHQGFGFPMMFGKIIIKNPNTESLLVDISVGVGKVQDDGPYGNPQVFVSTSIMRPDNTTPYTDGDVVGQLFAIGGLIRSQSGTGVLTKFQLIKETAVTTNASFRLYLFSTNNSVPTGTDNSPLALNYNSLARINSVIDIPSMFVDGAGVSAYAEVSGLNVSLASLDNENFNIYGLLVAKAAYVPAASESFRMLFWTRQD